MITVDFEQIRVGEHFLLCANSKREEFTKVSSNEAISRERFEIEIFLPGMACEIKEEL
jgi:hypothetical protein